MTAKDATRLSDLNLSRGQLLHGPRTLRQLTETSLAAIHRDLGTIPLSELSRRQRVARLLADEDPSLVSLGAALQKAEGA
ncbi:MAG: hypothetical protein IT384_32100 [Deltaproteobacteria bacterium]|nr:hypothetical protein [Deltaproteobacteria bacterium]